MFTKDAARRLLQNEQEVSRAQVGLSEIRPGPQCWRTTSSTVGSVSSVQRNERLRQTNGTVSAAPIPGRHRSSRRGGRISLRASEVSSVGQDAERRFPVRRNVLRPLSVQGSREPRTAVIHPAKPALCFRCSACQQNTSWCHGSHRLQAGGILLPGRGGRFDIETRRPSHPPLP